MLYGTNYVFIMYTRAGVYFLTCTGTHLRGGGAAGAGSYLPVVGVIADHAGASRQADRVARAVTSSPRSRAGNLGYAQVQQGLTALLTLIEVSIGPVTGAGNRDRAGRLLRSSGTPTTTRYFRVGQRLLYKLRLHYNTKTSG